MKIMAIIILALSYIQMGHAENNLSHTKDGHERSGTQENDKLSLDNGAKWKLDAHTREMFVSMSEKINAEGDLKEVGVKINEDLHQLIKGCTMTGAAHDQLHLFLLPYIPAVRELSLEGTEEAHEKVVDALQDYQNYFE